MGNLGGSAKSCGKALDAYSATALVRLYAKSNTVAPHVSVENLTSYQKRHHGPKIKLAHDTACRLWHKDVVGHAHRIETGIYSPPFPVLISIDPKILAMLQERNVILAREQQNPQFANDTPHVVGTAGQKDVA